jgi:putative transposase
MARSRKRHIQTEIVFRKWGGRRAGAGRKRRGPRRSVPHLRREDFNPRHPLHVTLRVLDDVPRLRRRDAFHAIRKSMLVVAVREDFRIVQLTIQGNHIHAVCEAASRAALTSGMTAFKTSAARRLNIVLGRSGRVFADRYHVEVLTSPRQVRNGLAYVLTKGSHCTSPWRVDLGWPRVTCLTWLLTSTIRRFHRRDPRFSHVVLDWSPWRSFPDRIDVDLRDRPGVPQDLRS